MAFSEEVSLYLTDEDHSFFDKNGSVGDFSYHMVKFSDDSSPSSSSFANTSAWEFVKYKGQSSILRRESLFPPQWYLTATLPQNTVFYAQKQLYRDLLLELAIIGLISYILACLTANSSLKRLLLLIWRQKNGSREFSGPVPHSGKDETDKLSIAFLL